MQRHVWFVALLPLLVGPPTYGGEWLSKEWKENGETNKITYATVEEMPAGSELRIRVSHAGRASIIVLDYRDGGPSRHVKKFENVSAGQILKLKLDKKMRVGINVGTPASASVDGCESKDSHHVLKYDFGNLGKFVLEAKVVSEDF